ncbi:DUF4190 domain-containing protein, partial [candidate division KSB1 bacterium]
FEKIPEDKTSLPDQDQKFLETKDSPAAPQTSSAAEDLPLNKKAKFSAICFFVPLVGNLLIWIINLITGGVENPNIVLGIFSILFTLGGIVLVPMSLILSILALKEIKKADKKQSGKGLAVSILSLSILAILTGIVMIIFFATSFDWSSVTQSAYENMKPQDIVNTMEKAINAKEKDNRENGIVNSFGNNYPQKLDDAEPLSESGPENPFFQNILEPLGIKGPGWKKGDSPNFYIRLSDSAKFEYDPQNGALNIKDN